MHVLRMLHLLCKSSEMRRGSWVDGVSFPRLSVAVRGRDELSEGPSAIRIHCGAADMRQGELGCPCRFGMQPCMLLILWLRRREAELQRLVAWQEIAVVMWVLLPHFCVESLFFGGA